MAGRARAFLGRLAYLEWGLLCSVLSWQAYYAFLEGSHFWSFSRSSIVTIAFLTLIFAPAVAWIITARQYRARMNYCERNGKQ